VAYSVDNMASQRTLRPKREVNWRKLHFGEDIPTEKPRLARTTFPDTFLLYDCCLFLKVKIVKVVAIISFLMPPYVKNKTKCTLILELILTSVSDWY
jgi:hypothetical protein